MIGLVKLFEFNDGSFGVTFMGAVFLFLLICAVAAGKQ